MAEGYVMTIPKEVLDKLTKADNLIVKIGEDSEKTRDRVIAAFKDMANGVSPLIEKVNALKSLGKIKLEATLKSSASAAENAASSIAQVATQLNRVADSPVEIINKKIESLRKLLEESTAASQKLANATVSGVVPKDVLGEGKAGASLSPQISGQIQYLSLERNELAQSNQMWQSYLKSLTDVSEMTKYYRKEFKEGTTTLQNVRTETEKNAAANEKLAIEQAKSAREAEKRAAAEKKLADAQKKKDDKANARALELYNSAMEKSEATIAQRARKIESLSKAQRALAQVTNDYRKEIVNIEVETKRLQKANENAAKSYGTIKKQQDSVLNTSDQLKRKLGLLFSVSAMQGYIEKLVTVRGEFELQQRALQAILQNKDEANALWDKTVALAIKSPFQVKELVTYTKQLAAYRIESDKLYDTTKMLADVSAGLGVDMGRLILAYGQVKAANYLRASEVRQFTEAGVNILGELADIYTELEGKMVSVGEIQDRITKRMVSFGDVEQVFKRITSAGGIFYNMQEIQAETLAGMISNLKDNFDVILNDIGKGHDNLLKTFISVINDLVANWRIFSDILSGVSTGFVLYAAKVAIATTATKGFTAANIENTISQKGLAGAMASSVNLLRKIGKFAKANPWVLAATAVAGLIAYYKDLNDKLKETRESYDILNNQIERQKKGLNDLINNIERQTDVQEKAETSLSNIKKGTKEYKEAEEKANAERQKTETLLKRLKKEFPEVYTTMMKNKDGIKSLRDEQKKYNDELERTETLNRLMQADVPLFGGSFKETSQEYENAWKRQNKAIESLQGAYNSLVKEMRFYIQTQDAIPQSTKDAVDSIINSNSSIEEKTRLLLRYSRNFRARVTDDNRQLSNLSRDAQKSLDELKYADESRASTLAKMNDSYVSLRKNALKEAGVTLEEFKKLTKAQQEDVGKRMAAFIKSTAGAENTFSRLFLKKRIQQDFGISISFDEKKTEKAFSDLQKIINKRVAEVNKTIDKKTQIQPIRVEEGTTDYINNLYKIGQSLIEEADRVHRSQHNLRKDLSETKATAESMLRKYGEAAKALAKEFGVTDKKEQNKEESAYEKRLRAQLDLLKKMQSQYEKLRETMGATDAKKTITDSFTDAYKKLFDKPLSLKFDKASIANEMESIASTISGKSAHELRRAWDSTIGQLRAEISVTADIDSIQSFEREIESMFTNYQLYIELEAKGLDKDLMKNIFGINATSLQDIREALEKQYQDISELGEKQLDSYFKILKKIKDMERKDLEERFKEYSKYLKRTMSERVRIEMEAQDKINKIPKEFQADQRQEIIDNIRKETQKNLDKQAWSDFKGSDLYVKLFEDLDNVSTRTLEKLREKLLDLKNSLKDLPADELKTIVYQINKVESEIVSRNPFKGLLGNLKEYISLIRNKGELEQQFVESSAKSESLQRQIEEQEKAYELSKRERDEAIKTYGAQSDQAKAADQKVQRLYTILNITKQEKIQQDKVTETIGDQIDKAKELGERLAKAAQKFSQRMNEANGLISDIQSTFGGMMSDSANDTLSSVQDIIGGVSTIGDGIGQIFSGNIVSGGIKVLSGLVKTIGSVFAIGDKKREREIQNELKNVEKLQKAYEKLEKAIDKAYTIDTLNRSTENAQKNLDQQIESYQKMIAAEEDKKKSDKERIEEWKNTIEDLEEKRAEIRKNKLDELGAFGSEENIKSAAESFADAWLDAYQETGDGLDALNEKWDEYINNIIKKQLALRAAEQFLKPVMDLVNKALEDSYLDIEEKKEIEEAKKKASDLMNTFFKEIVGGFDIPITGGTDSGTTLSKGIQSVTEQTANVIEAYLNSMRFFVSDSNMQLQRIASFFTEDPTQSPLISELMSQTRLLRSIDDRLSSVITSAGNHPHGGSAIKALI